LAIVVVCPVIGLVVGYLFAQPRRAGDPQPHTAESAARLSAQARFRDFIEACSDVIIVLTPWTAGWQGWRQMASRSVSGHDGAASARIGRC